MSARAWPAPTGVTHEPAFADAPDQPFSDAGAYIVLGPRVKREEWGDTQVWSNTWHKLRARLDMDDPDDADLLREVDRAASLYAAQREREQLDRLVIGVYDPAGDPQLTGLRRVRPGEVMIRPICEDD